MNLCFQDLTQYVASPRKQYGRLSSQNLHQDKLSMKYIWGKPDLKYKFVLKENCEKIL